MKHLIIACLAFALLAVPAGALADNGGGSAAPQRGAGRAGGEGDQLKDLGKRIHDAVKACKKAKGDQRTECVKKAIAALEDLKAKIDGLEAKIRAKCSSTDASAAAPKRCARADKLIERLEHLKSKIDALEAKLQAKSAGQSSP